MISLLFKVCRCGSDGRFAPIQPVRGIDDDRADRAVWCIRDVIGPLYTRIVFAFDTGILCAITNFIAIFKGVSEGSRARACHQPGDCQSRRKHSLCCAGKNHHSRFLNFRGGGRSAVVARLLRRNRRTMSFHQTCSKNNHTPAAGVQIGCEQIYYTGFVQKIQASIPPIFPSGIFSRMLDK